MNARLTHTCWLHVQVFTHGFYFSRDHILSGVKHVSYSHVSSDYILAPGPEAHPNTVQSVVSVWMLDCATEASKCESLKIDDAMFSKVEGKLKLRHTPRAKAGQTIWTQWKGFPASPVPRTVMKLWSFLAVVFFPLMSLHQHSFQTYFLFFFFFLSLIASDGLS